MIKGLQLEGLRVIGPVTTVSQERYLQGFDELLLIDSVASLYGRDSIVSAIRAATESVFVPVTAGGGIRRIEDARAYFLNGADRVAINSAALATPRLIREIAEVYGAQGVVISIEAKRVGNSSWNCFFESGREDSKIEIRDWVSSLSAEWVGEVLLTSVDNDGLLKGPDNHLLEEVAAISPVPIIYSGGIADRSQALQVLSHDAVTALAIGAAGHYGRLGPREIKNSMREFGLDAREAL